jgi:predicted PurR-regulated permease PerM
MSSPVFGAMSGQNGGNIIQQFQQFMQQMKGKNPQEEINKLLQSGKVSQQQLNQVQQQAQQMQGMFKGFFK